VLRLADLDYLPRPGSARANWGAFLAVCHEAGIWWPDRVIDEFLWSHGKNERFRRQYGHVDLPALVWELQSLTARELLASSFDEDLGGRVLDVAANPHWYLAQYRPPDALWGDDTWSQPPLLMPAGFLTPPKDGLHLVEGHTRLGVMRGLVELGELSADSTHQVYVASARA
jgi:hypothetical protein